MKKRSQARRKGETWWPGHAETDPQGSWTGKPEDPMETPVQDADDLYNKNAPRLGRSRHRRMEQCEDRTGK